MQYFGISNIRGLGWGKLERSCDQVGPKPFPDNTPLPSLSSSSGFLISWALGKLESRVQVLHPWASASMDRAWVWRGSWTEELTVSSRVGDEDRRNSKNCQDFLRAPFAPGTISRASHRLTHLILQGNEPKAHKARWGSRGIPGNFWSKRWGRRWIRSCLTGQSGLKRTYLCWNVQIKAQKRSKHSWIKTHSLSHGPTMGSGILCVVGGRGGVGRIVCMFRQDWHQEEVTAFLPHHSHRALFNHTLREGQARRRRPWRSLMPTVAIIMKLPVCQMRLCPFPLKITTILQSSYYCPFLTDGETRPREG